MVRISAYWNSATRTIFTVPRHREVKEFTARKTRGDLEVPEP